MSTFGFAFCRVKKGRLPNLQAAFVFLHGLAARASHEGASMVEIFLVQLGGGTAKTFGEPAQVNQADGSPRNTGFQ